MLERSTRVRVAQRRVAFEMLSQFGRAETATRRGSRSRDGMRANRMRRTIPRRVDGPRRFGTQRHGNEFAQGVNTSRPTIKRAYWWIPQWDWRPGRETRRSPRIDEFWRKW